MMSFLSGVERFSLFIGVNVGKISLWALSRMLSSFLRGWKSPLLEAALSSAG